MPAVHYYETEKAKDVFRKKSNRKTKREKEREKRRKNRERQPVNVIAPADEYLDSMMFLEMQMFQMDDVDGKIIPNVEDKSQEEREITSRSQKGVLDYYYIISLSWSPR